MQVRLLFLNALRFRRGAEIDLSQSVTIGSIIADDGHGTEIPTRTAFTRRRVNKNIPN